MEPDPSFLNLRLSWDLEVVSGAIRTDSPNNYLHYKIVYMYRCVNRLYLNVHRKFAIIDNNPFLGCLFWLELPYLSCSILMTSYRQTQKQGQAKDHGHITVTVAVQCRN